ncbi:MAG: DUF1893 domain-containing protein [Candidatus Njordarchaeia archaeon]|nr:DUF1893 domain-containing protein [Candidatus Korarchaeota archaeon]
MYSIDELKRLLKDFSLIILKNKKIIYKSEKQGIIPLIEALEMPNKLALENSIIADRITGKAAALLFALIKPQFLFTIVISRQAKTFLENIGLSFRYERLVEKIMNRDKTDVCPFEKITEDVEDPYLALELIRKKVKEFML